ncbi:unnamed protein product [Bursaphelenchus okinawaensis]|uniref:Uncharacterized protein n=1 Tax=Bursaphelenchus okinawaensis TaxID=465554 RepID=A0A811JTC6_9BILA|nr:unnamed protein product [Bursaphelenchus okinawaensis]CAG9082870.1 unnamed protein product [Bursaphelenchus okinawaensis]
MSQKETFPKLYRIPKKADQKLSSKDQVLTSPLVKTNANPPAKPKPTPKITEKHKTKETKHETTKRKHSQAFHKQHKSNANKDPIELLDSIWKEMEEDDMKKKHKRSDKDGCTPNGSPLYQHAATPTPGTSQPKFTKYELLSAPKDDTVLKRLMNKSGLMERILAFKIKHSKMDSYRNIRVHGRLDECVMPDDQSVDYGTPRFQTEINQQKGPQTPPGRGPQTPPGSPDMVSEGSHGADYERAKTIVDDILRAEVGNTVPMEEGDKASTASRINNSSSSTKTNENNSGFFLPPPPPPPMISKPSTPPPAVSVATSNFFSVDLTKNQPSIMSINLANQQQPPTAINLVTRLPPPSSTVNLVSRPPPPIASVNLAIRPPPSTNTVNLAARHPPQNTLQPPPIKLSTPHSINPTTIIHPTDLTKPPPINISQPPPNFQNVYRPHFITPPRREFLPRPPAGFPLPPPGSTPAAFPRPPPPEPSAMRFLHPPPPEFIPRGFQRPPPSEVVPVASRAPPPETTTTKPPSPKTKPADSEATEDDAPKQKPKPPVCFGPPLLPPIERSGAPRYGPPRFPFRPGFRIPHPPPYRMPPPLPHYNLRPPRPLAPGYHR